MDLIKIAEEALRVTKNVYSCTVVLLSKLLVTVTRSVLQYAKCLEQ